MQSRTRLALYAGVWSALAIVFVPRCAALGVDISNGSAMVRQTLHPDLAPDYTESENADSLGESVETGIQLSRPFHSEGGWSGYDGYLESSGSARFGTNGARLGGHAIVQFNIPGDAPATFVRPNASSLTSLAIQFEEQVTVLALLTGDNSSLWLENYAFEGRKAVLHGVTKLVASFGVSAEGHLGPQVFGFPQSVDQSRKGAFTFYFFEYTDPNEFDLLRWLRGRLKSDPVRPETRTIAFGTSGIVANIAANNIPPQSETGATPFGASGEVSSLLVYDDVVYETTVAIPVFDGYGLNADVYFESDATIPNGPLEGARVDGFTLSSSDLTMRLLSVPSDTFIPSGATIEYGGSSFSLEPGLTFDLGSEGVASLVVAGLQSPGLAPAPLLFSLQFVEEGATELDFDYDLYHPPGDFDLDGTVDGRDFLVWQRNPSAGSLSDWQANYGNSSLNAAVNVPEPGAVVIMIGLAAVIGIRRKACAPPSASS